MAFEALLAFVGADVRARSVLDIRGDDTKVVNPFYLDALGVKLLYDVLGAVANEQKFGLYRARVEFLRIETSDRARGYPMRSVSALSQRRPWNATPWREEAVLAGLVKSCAVLRRHSPFPEAVDAVRDHLCAHWFARLHLDPRLGTITAACGGLGLAPWEGTLAVRQWASQPPAPVTITNRTAYRAGQVARRFLAFEIPVTAETAEKIAADRLSAKLASDDVPALVPEIWTRSRAELARREMIETLTAMADSVAFLECATPRPGTFARVTLQARGLARQLAPGYGAARRFMPKVSALAELAKATR